jgi:hypothetical protein
VGTLQSLYSKYLIFFGELLMSNSAISPIASSRPNPVQSLSTLSVLPNNDAAQNMNTLADTLSKALTSGGKASFATPGAQQDFQSNLRAAVGDMVKGSQSGNKDQMMKGINDLLALLAGLAKSEGKNPSKDEGSCGGGSPQSASGSNPTAKTPSSSSTDEDKKKKLLELIQMLLSMGVPPEMIAQLMQSMGMSPAESQQLLGEAVQGAGQNTDQSGLGASMKKDAIAA